MSGGGGEQTVGYRYYLGMHLAVCKGPVDMVTAINVGERAAWTGSQSANGTISIVKPELFGGDEREGGINGGLEVMMGAPTQLANSYLTIKQGGNQSGHRGVLSFVWNGGQVSSNNPYLKAWAFRVRRILVGWHSDGGRTAWYPTTAPIQLSETGSVTGGYTNGVSPADIIWRKVIWVPSLGKFIATGNGGANGTMWSPDGITWTLAAAGSSTDWYCVAFGGSGILVSLSDAGTLMTSPDGLTWTLQAAPTFGQWRDIVWNGTIFVAVGGNAAGVLIMTSSNGTSWTARTPATVTALACLAWGAGLFVALTVAGGCMTSPDGITWTTRTMSGGTGWQRVEFANGLFVAVGSGNFQTSPDGITWTARTPAGGSDFRAVAWNGRQFAVVGNTSVVNVSADGITWTVATSALASLLYLGIASNGSIFAGVAGSGTGNRVFLGLDVTTPGMAMNPAHIVYECLTNLQWGMGYPTSIINDANFRAAADVFFAEGMGLCLHWTQQQPIEKFVQIVLDHAGAMLAQEPTTGLFTLTPLRGGYTVGTLPLFDETNIKSIEFYEKAAPPESANEISVRFDDLVTAKTGSVKVQNLGMIRAQGGVAARTVNYPGFPVASLAMRAAMRDLVAGSIPLGRVRMFVNRSGYTLRPGGLIRWTWPKLGITTMVLRILKVNLGSLADGLIGIEAVEDVFGVPTATYAAQPATGWTAPNSAPSAATNRVVREAGYLEVLRQLGPSDTAALADDAGFVVAAAVRPTADAIDFGMLTRTGVAAYDEIGRGSFCPSGTVSVALEPGATTATITNLVDPTLVEVGTYAQIENEIVRVDAWNAISGIATLGRGVVGTCAALHPALTRIYFLDGFLANDNTERVDAEVVNVKLAPRTGLGQLLEASAPANAVILDQAFFRPYAPGQLRINGAAYPASVAGAFGITWKHRNRLQQNLEGDESGDIGPEASTTYNAWLRNHLTSAVVDSVTGVTGTAWAPTTLPTTPGLYRIELQAERSGLTSAQMHRYVFTWVDPFTATASLITRGAYGATGASSRAVAPGRTLQATATFLPGAAYVAA